MRMLWDPLVDEMRIYFFLHSNPNLGWRPRRRRPRADRPGTVVVGWRS
jgi:hypothetical protein